MTTPTPRTDATCKAIAAMLEPLRGGTRVTDAEMKAVEGVIESLATCAVDLERDLAAAQLELERERMRLAACGVVAMANTPESATEARKMHEDYRSASLSDVERAVDAEMKLRTELATAQAALQFVERWANHHGQKACVKPEHALATIQHYPPILAITRSYADGKVPETRNPWAELKEAQEARERAEEEDLKTRMMYHDALERAAACEKDAERMKHLRSIAYAGVNTHHRTTLWALRGLWEKDGQSFDEAIDAAIAAGAK